ncbi:MAG TPA: hypothetical protein VM143_14730 [Acidimicrobiales bacterium]|nr:hypothetical protein [Acidimicrobiales bacterium]
MTDLHVPDPVEPDFESLYLPHVDGDGWQMTPRMASHLWGAATILGDEWRTCITDPELLAENLPPVARPYAHNRSWLEQFIEGFDRLAERLGGPGDSDCLARCTAEELALHLTINTAEASIADGVVDSVWVDHLPDHGRADQDFDWMRQVLFEDHDVLMLFDPALDGLEHSPGVGTAYLHPRDWFQLFRPVTAIG